MLEIIFETVFEKLAEVIVFLPLTLIPGEKYSDKTEKKIIIVTVLVSLLFMFLFISGLFMASKSGIRGTIGKFFMCLTPLQFLLSLVLYIIKKIKEKLKK